MFSFLTLNEQKRKVYKYRHLRSTMSLTNIIKSAWNNTIKPIVTNPWSYATLAAFSLGGFAKAQDNSEINDLKQKYSVNQEESKLEKPTGEYNINGKITGTDAQGLDGIEVKRILFNDNWPASADTSITFTNTDGYFNTTYTGIDEIVTIENLGQLTYYWNKIESPKNGSVTVSNILGQELFTQEISAGKNIINLDNYANGVYFTTTTIDEVKTTNKLVKVDETYPLTGKIHKDILKETRQTLEKTTDEVYTYYGFELTDPNGEYYKQQFQPWNNHGQINSTDISVKLPMLEKGNITPFNNPRTGALVDDVNELEYFLAGSDIIPNGNALYYPSKKPILVYQGLDNLPSNFSATNINAGTEQMMSTTSMNPDSLWKPIDHYINPFDTLNCVMNYLYLDNAALDGHDMILTFYNKSDQTRGFDFKFNKETIEPQYIKKAVQLATQIAINGYDSFIPLSDAHSQDLRNGVEVLSDGERKVYNHLLQVDNRMWIGPDIIGPNSSLTKPLEFEKPAGVDIYKIKFTQNEPIIEKEFIDMNTYKKQLENQQMYDQMKNELEQKDFK